MRSAGYQGTRVGELRLDFDAMPLEKLYQSLFNYLALGTHATFGLNCVDLQGLGHRFG